MADLVSVRTVANLALLAVLIPVVVLVSQRVLDRSTGSPALEFSRAWLYVLFGLASLGYLVPGDLMGWDAPNHVARTWIFADAMAHLEIPPTWTYRWYLGFPLSLYYGPVYYLTTGLVSLVLGGSVFTATKISLWILHVLSGIGMFALGCSLMRSHPAALFAATFYVMSFQHLAIIMQAGALPLSIIFTVLPWALLLLERLLTARAARPPMLTAFPLALLLSVMFLTHTQYGLLAIATVYVIALCRLALAAPSPPPGALSRLALTGALTGLFCSWLVLPLILESRHVMLGRDGLGMVLGDARRLATRSAWLDVVRVAVRSDISRTMTIYYFGLFPVLVSLAAWLGRWRSRGVPRTAYLMCWPVALVYAVVNVRFMTFVFVLTVILSGFAIATLERSSLGRRPAAWPVIYGSLLMLMVLDLGPMLVPPRFGTFMEYTPRRPRGLSGKVEAPARILSVYPTEVTLWSHVVVIDSGLATVLGGVPQEAPPSYPYVAAIASKVTAEVVDQAGPLTRDTVDALRLLNVRFVWAPQTDVFVEIALPSPVWFSPRLVEAGSAPRSSLETMTWQALRKGFDNRDLDYATPLQIVRAMEPESSRPIVRAISVVDAPPGRPDDGQGAERGVDCRVVDHREGHSKVTIRYACSDRAYALLAYSFFPDAIVEIDEMKSSRVFRASMNLTAVAVPAGEHTLVLKARVSTIRRGLFIMAAAGVLASGLWFAVVRWRGGRSDARGGAGGPDDASEAGV